MVEYVIGIDGGGTRSRLAISDLDGNIIWRTEGDSTNRYAVSEEDMKNAYREVFRRAFEVIRPSELSAVCIGSAGLCRPLDIAFMEDFMSEILPETTKLKLVNDCQLLLFGGLPSSTGLALISGTGSICYGLDEKGDMVRSGGLGWRLGDEGSAWHMADVAARLVLRAEDGRGECSEEVRKSVLDYFNVDSPSDLIPILNSKDLEKSYVAHFAPRLSELAEKGDETANCIIEDEVDELYLLVLSCYEKMFEGKDADLILSGGVMEHDRLVRGKLEDVISERLPEVHPVEAVGTALHGAVKLALAELDIHVPLVHER